MKKPTRGRGGFLTTVTFIFLLSSCGGGGVPFDLNATPISPHAIALSWTFYQPVPVSEEDCTSYAFNIYRNGNYIDWTGSTSYEDDVLPPASYNCYMVASFCSDNLIDFLFNETLESDKSAEVCTETFPLSNVSGAVTYGGAPLEGVTITLVAVHPNSGSISQPTDEHGEYVFESLENGVYLIYPEDEGFTFLPDNWQVAIQNGDLSDYDFEALLNGSR